MKCSVRVCVCVDIYNVACLRFPCVSLPFFSHFASISLSSRFLQLRPPLRLPSPPHRRSLCIFIRALFLHPYSESSFTLAASALCSLAPHSTTPTRLCSRIFSIHFDLARCRLQNYKLSLFHLNFYICHLVCIRKILRVTIINLKIYNKHVWCFCAMCGQNAKQTAMQRKS